MPRRHAIPEFCKALVALASFGLVACCEPAGRLDGDRLGMLIGAADTGSFPGPADRVGFASSVESERTPASEAVGPFPPPVLRHSFRPEVLGTSSPEHRDRVHRPPRSVV